MSRARGPRPPAAPPNGSSTSSSAASGSDTLVSATSTDRSSTSGAPGAAHSPTSAFRKPTRPGCGARTSVFSSSRSARLNDASAAATPARAAASCGTRSARGSGSVPSPVHSSSASRARPSSDCNASRACATWLRANSTACSYASDSIRKSAAPSSTRAPSRRPGADQTTWPATSAETVVRRDGRTVPSARTVTRCGPTRTVAARTSGSTVSISCASGLGPSATRSASRAPAPINIGTNKNLCITSPRRPPSPLRSCARTRPRVPATGSPGCRAAPAPATGGLTPPSGPPAPLPAP